MFGIPTVALVSAAAGGLGAYNIGKWLADRAQLRKQQLKEAKEVYSYVKYAAFAGKKLHDALSTPEARAAKIRELNTKLKEILEETDEAVAPPTV